MAVRNRLTEDEPQSTTSWMITYTDLCTLLLTFFVLLISMSVVDQDRKKKALNSLDGVIGFSSTGRSVIGISDRNEAHDFSYSLEEKEPIDYEALKNPSLKKDVPQEMEIFKKNGKTYIQINQQALFEPASYNITPRLQSFLATLARHLSESDEEIEIRGHTDAYEGINRPYWARGSWGLSSKRAHSVYNYLMEQGVPADRLSAHGFSFYRPVVDSLAYPHLRNLNERVEIILGPNESLPSSLFVKKTRVSPYVNYKNFFFKLFPVPENAQTESRNSNMRGTF